MFITNRRTSTARLGELTLIASACTLFVYFWRLRRENASAISNESHSGRIKPQDFVLAHPEDASAIIDDQDFCPRATAERRATIIMIPLDDGSEPWDTDDAMERTSFLGTGSGSQGYVWSPPSEMSSLPNLGQEEPPEVNDIGFLPSTELFLGNEVLRKPRKIASTVNGSTPCPVYYVPASSHHLPIPRIPGALSKAPELPTFAESQYSPAEVGKWHREGYPEYMFGFATSPSRILEFIPRWKDFLPSSMPDIERRPNAYPQNPSSGSVNNGIRRFVPRVVVLTPPGEELDEAWEVQHITKGAGLDMRLKETYAERYEVRYFMLLKHLWEEAMQLESQGRPEFQWFIISDDDTFFLSLETLTRTLAKYSPDKPHIIGGDSEWQIAMDDHQGIAFGGAGIVISRALMKKINTQGRFEVCKEQFADIFGGDGMISNCAALLMGKKLKNAVTKERTLHQLDLRSSDLSSGTGIFEAGWRFTTIHHWASWFTFMPLNHPYTLKSDRAVLNLVGKAAQSVSPENWARRYVWGMGNGKDKEDGSKGSVVLSLGFSLVVNGAGVVSKADLGKVEQTQDHPLVWPTRPPLREGDHRRTYYLYNVETWSANPTALSPGTDVAMLSHVDEDGGVIDIVWDRRRRSSKGLYRSGRGGSAYDRD